MNIIVYIDLYFFINLGFDYCILAVESKLIKRHVSQYRLISASLFGSMSSCFVLICQTLSSFTQNIICYIVIPVVMVWIAFGLQSYQRIISSILYLYGVAIVIGGILCIVFFNTTIGASISNIFGTSHKNSISLIALVIAMAIIMLCAPFLTRRMSQYRSRINILYEVSMVLEDKVVSAKGLLDTGNDLRDPISSRPAIIVEKTLMEQLMTKGMFEYATRIKVIPFHSVGKEEGMMYALVIDRLSVVVNGEVHSFSDVVACVYEGTLSSKKDYQLILHKEFV